MVKHMEHSTLIKIASSGTSFGFLASLVIGRRCLDIILCREGHSHFCGLPEKGTTRYHALF